MKKYLEIIKSSMLFRGMDDDEIESALADLAVTRREYAKNEFILRAGEEAHAVGLVLSGSVHIIKEDFTGNKNIVAEVGPGEIFAESYACVRGAPLGVSAEAAERCEALFMDVERLLSACSPQLGFQARLLSNLLAVLAQKNLNFSEKLTHITQRTTRAKLLSYLSAESVKRGTREFEIPFNRQQLADYLSVDRSALSGELSKMRAEGLLDYHKNRFTLAAHAGELS